MLVKGGPVLQASVAPVRVTSMFSLTKTFPVMTSRRLMVIVPCPGLIIPYVCMSFSWAQFAKNCHLFNTILSIVITFPTASLDPRNSLSLIYVCRSNPSHICVLWCHKRLQYVRIRDVLLNKIRQNHDLYLRVHGDSRPCGGIRKSLDAYVKKFKTYMGISTYKSICIWCAMTCREYNRYHI